MCVCVRDHQCLSVRVCARVCLCMLTCLHLTLTCQSQTSKPHLARDPTPHCLRRLCVPWDWGQGSAVARILWAFSAPDRQNLWPEACTDRGTWAHSSTSPRKSCFNRICIGRRVLRKVKSIEVMEQPAQVETRGATTKSKPTICPGSNAMQETRKT